MKITLTFDNGPDPEVTPFVLDVLARHGIKSTFFVVGDKLRDPARLALCRRAHEEGHWIGNHTFNHLVPLGLARYPDLSTQEIARTQELIGPLAHPDRLFRPFGEGGLLTPSLLDRPAVEYLLANRFTCVLWNAIPRDWEDTRGWVETALEQCAALDWALIVLHDLPTGGMARLEAFLTAVAERGGHFVQEFPEDCVPIRRGVLTADISGLVAAA